MESTEAVPSDLEPIAALRTVDGLFVADDRQRIVYWSPSAERILGVPAAEAVGRTCFDVLVGTDYAGNPFCRSQCPIASNAARGRPVPDYEVVARTKDGSRKLINSSILLSRRCQGGHAVVHLFREVRSGARTPPARPPRLKARRDAIVTSPLSRRELDVLRLVAAGLKTADIAKRLGVSYFTARNQVSSMLRKLDARNRTEAVTRAAEHGIL